MVRFDTVAAPPAEGAVDVRGDITQLTHLLEAIADHGVTRIVHLAALLPPTTEERPHTGLLVNVQGAANVFEAARWAKTERVVYASSIACYGDQSNFGERAVTEDDPSQPFNVYGQTKAVNDFTRRAIGSAGASTCGGSASPRCSGMGAPQGSPD